MQPVTSSASHFHQSQILLVPPTTVRRETSDSDGKICFCPERCTSRLTVAPQNYSNPAQHGYWGQYLFQSDPDYDVLDELSERAGFELFFFESEEEETKARNALDEGEFNELFDIITEEKKKRSLVLLTAVAMRVGAKVKQNQRNLIEKIYKKAHLMAGAERQIEKALKEYENGKSWHFKESRGLMETMETMDKPDDEGFTSPFIIKPEGGQSREQSESTKEANKEEQNKTFEERATENVQKLFADPDYQKYLASTMEK
ncbi:hypothetical protein EPUS_08578 [Endocarpon pusillum Z07020]|uniref:Uncharacterized protein n=1 Tax=Endocarpon pusillum (strain Z07020 / HMAS-L-300199) TaxID=1263415 RepID=U1HT86_ENDPU|nr:uncharacterized protein EPUS_08578 [Endocarpon pusillum Z07020]ERF73780.1 hypothetical protein EPUS_08578 [Endocarpon pusillum Z07020]